MIVSLAQPEMMMGTDIGTPRTFPQLIKDNPIISQLALTPIIPAIEAINRHSDGSQNTIGLVCLAVSCALVPLAFAAISKIANRDAHLMDTVDAKFNEIDAARKSEQARAKKDLNNVQSLQDQFGQTTSAYGKKKLKEREVDAKKKLR